MRRFFILLMCLAHSASAQSIVISGGGQSITVSGQAASATSPQSPEKSAETPPAATPEFKEVEPSEIDKLKSEVAELKIRVAESTKKSSQPHALSVPTPAPVKPSVPAPQRKVQQRFLVSESWCSACPAARSRFLSSGGSRENILTMAQSRQMFPKMRFPNYVPYEFTAYVEDSSQSQPAAAVSVSRPVTTTIRKRLPVVQTQWGRVDLETYNRNCNCPMCQGIRQLQSQYRQMSIQKTQEPVNDHPGQQPTPADTLTQMVDLLRLTPSDVLADIGCGDGRILIAAVKQYGCRGVGVEIDADQARRARTAVDAAGLSDRITIITGDALEFEPQTHGITAITAYLFPHLLERLAPRLKFARVVASPFHAIPGLQMTQHGDVWLYRQQNQTQPQQTTGITQIQIPGFNREDEIDHLMDPDSPHAGRFIRSNLERLTDMQLIDLHNREHGLHTVDGVRVSSR